MQGLLGKRGVDWMMKPVTLTKDQSMRCMIQCNCARSDGNGWSLSPRACIEWQEGRLYIMCEHCGRLEFANAGEEE